MKTKNKNLTADEKAQVRAKAKAKMEDFKQNLANQILDIIQQGEQGDSGAKWEKSWEACPLSNGLPINPVSKHVYRGTNQLSLMLYMMKSNTNDPRFCTYRQAKKLGEALGQDIHVEAGVRGIPILRPVIIKDRNEDATTDDEAAENELFGALNDMQGENDKTETGASRVFFRVDKVFHASQIVNMPSLEERPEPTWTSHEVIERLVKASGVPVFHDVSDDPHYSPSTDKIRMPPKSAFNTRNGYYATLLHEWFHSTGHASRENRFGNTLKFNGLEEYAREELRAELFSALASAALGVPHKLTSAAKYLEAWKQKIKDSPNEIVIQAVPAGKMLDVVMDFAYDEQPKTAPWFPKKETWPPKSNSLDSSLDTEDFIQNVFSDEDPFAELDELDFGSSMKN